MGLEITTFGGVDIRVNGTRALFPTRKAQALLIYVAVTGKAQSREHLADVLWDDRSQQQALSNLRTTLTRLNAVLGDHLVITRQSVSINPDMPVWLDAYVLASAFAEAERGGDAAEKASLYQGEFLAGFHLSDCRGFEDWVTTQREFFRAGMTWLLRNVIERSWSQQQFSAGLEHARNLLNIDPLDEFAHRAIMRFLTVTGQRSAALAQYHTCRHLLEDELDVEPEAATNDLYQQIYSGSFTALPKPRFNNLPAAVTPFVGREAELEQIVTALNDPDCRILSLVGAGGMGKTRLAYQAAAQQVDQFADGVCVVGLTDVQSAATLTLTIADGLNLRVQGDARAVLLDTLRDKNLLLVMDNCEQLLGEVSLFADILASAPHVRILATSRQRLQLRGEWVIALDGLAYDGRRDAQTLFAQAARRILPTFPPDDAAVTTICQLVEGMPLALEIAAAWLRLMPLEQITTEIVTSIDFLTTTLRDVPERHRSIRALLRHSWGMLTLEEQSALANLAVFRGGFTLASASEVAGANRFVLAALLDKSLIRVSATGRYDLHELVRQFAWEQLEGQPNPDAALERHLAYFHQWGEGAFHKHQRAPKIWFSHVDVEQLNLEAAIEYAFTHDRLERGFQLANALWVFWFRGKRWREALRLYQLALRQPQPPTAAYAEGIFYASTYRFNETGLPEWLMTLFGSAFEIAERLDLKRLKALLCIAQAYRTASYEEAAAFLDRAAGLLRENVDSYFLTLILIQYGDRARVQGEFDTARRIYGEALELSRRHEFLLFESAALHNLGRLEVYARNYLNARQMMQAGLHLSSDIGNSLDVAEMLPHLAQVELYLGNVAESERLLQENLRQWQEIGQKDGVAHAQHLLAYVALQKQDATAVSYLWSSLLATDPDSGNFSILEFYGIRVFIAARIAQGQGDDEAAARFLGAAQALCERIHFQPDPFVLDDFDRADRSLKERLGDDLFSAVWQSGFQLSQPEAIYAAQEYLRQTFKR